MAKSDKGSERGIDPDADYGTQFLNAKKGEPPPPPPPTGAAPAAAPPPEEKEGGAGKVIMIVVAIFAVLGGILGFVAFAGGGDDSDGDDNLITAGGVEIRDTDRAAPTTTTTKPEPTTTKPPETTTTTTAPPTTLPPTTLPPVVPTLPPVTVPGGFPVVTTLPGQPLPPPTAPPTTGVTCPGGSVSTRVDGAISTLVGDQWKVEVDGTTLNNTTASINLGVTVPVTYKPTGSGNKTDEVKPAQFNQSVRPGTSLKWTIDLTIPDSTTQPTIAAPTGDWTWTDASFASCPTNAFG